MRRKIITNLKTAISFAQGKGLVAQNVATAVRIKSDDRGNSAGPLRAGTDFPASSELDVGILAAINRHRPFHRYARQPTAPVAVARCRSRSRSHPRQAAGGCLEQDRTTQIESGQT